MIVNGLLIAVTALLRALFSLIPSFTLPSWLASASAFPSGVATTIGGYLHTVQPYFPIDTILQVISDVLVLWPVIIGYLVFQWVWAHLPTIAGFGSGDGGG